MIQKSAGILLYRLVKGNVEVFLVHPGGPFFAKKDLGVWTIAKGEFTNEEEPLPAAIREFYEETGKVLKGRFMELAPVKQKSGKIVFAWAMEGDFDERELKSNLFQMEWPPRSGRFKEFPEIDKGAWFSPEMAKQKINSAQCALIEELLSKLNL